MSIILSKSCTAPPFSEKEAMRYAGVGNADGNLSELLFSCLGEAEKELKYTVCYTELELKMSGDVCDFGIFKIKSRDLSKSLRGCKRAVLFAATVGIGIDRLIAKYSRLSPSRAIMLDALGTERIEALCDEFCREFEGARPRFSPGYGDLSLDVQRELFILLDAPRKAGISLNESLMMSPTKSVTAIMGIEK